VVDKGLRVLRGIQQSEAAPALTDGNISFEKEDDEEDKDEAQD